MGTCTYKAGLKISIITACYNSERYIEDTIKSVLSQTYDNIEYIIIDGGSTDGTLEIIEKYYPKLDYAVSEADSGIYEAFNKGIRASTGDIVYFLNSDDYLIDEDSIDIIAKVFEEDESLRVVYGNILIVDEKCKHEHTFGREMNLEDFKKGCMPPHPGTFVKRELFQTHGFFNEAYKICSDFEFMLKCFLSAKGGIVYVNKTIAVFREGGKSSDYMYGKIRNMETREIVSKYFGEVNKTDIDINALFRCWLETLLLHGKGITGTLRSYNIKNVAIFGTRKTALYLYNDLKKENFNIVRFLDNNINMHGQKIYDTVVEATEWLLSNHVDAIIVSIENSYDTEVIKHLCDITEGKALVVSWKELVMDQ